MSEVLQHTSPEHLGAEHLRAYVLRGIIDLSLAARVMDEAYESGEIRPEIVNDFPQRFERLPVDHTRENSFTALEELGATLHERIVPEVTEFFPAASNFVIDESVAQIYRPTSKERALVLGWHQDHKLDEYLVIATHLDGADGILEFGTTDPAYKDPAPQATIETYPGDAVVFACNGLYKSDEANINRRHRVFVRPGDPRYTIQFRMGVNAGDYGNKAVNHDAPLKSHTRSSI